MSQSSRAASGYRGPDRRALVPTSSPVGGALVLVLLGGALAAGSLGLAGVALLPQLQDDLWLLALGLWSTVAMGSGVAWLVAWRIAGWAAAARIGTCTVAAAALITVVPRLTTALGEAPGASVTRPLVVGSTLLGAGICTALALRRPVVDPAVAPVRELVLLVGLTVLGVLVAASAVRLGWLPGPAQVRAWPVAACAVTVAWLTWEGAWHRSAVSRALLLAWGLLGLAFWAHVRVSVPGDLAALAAIGGSSALVVLAATGSVRAGLATHRLRSLRTLAVLAEQSDTVRRERERRHDALNALASIRTASEVLAASSSGLDDATRGELARAARAELARVERLLAAQEDGATGTTGPDVLRPLVATWSRRGLDLHLEVEPTATTGWPPAVADAVQRIVDNLLQNAHRHAVGSRVLLQVGADDAGLRVVVRDRGPGIPEQRRAALFSSRVADADRTAPATGMGLGLVSAHRLAAELGGELRLEPTPVGACFVLTLPHAAGRAGDQVDRQQVG